MSRIELGLELGGVAPSVTRKDRRSRLRHPVVPVLLDVSDRGVDLPRADAEQGWRLRSRCHPFFVIVEDVVDGDPSAGDLGPSATVDDPGFQGMIPNPPIAKADKLILLHPAPVCSQVTRRASDSSITRSGSVSPSKRLLV